MYSTGAQSILGGSAELTEMPGTGIEVVPNIPQCRVLVLRSYRTLPECADVAFFGPIFFSAAHSYSVD